MTSHRLHLRRLLTGFLTLLVLAVPTLVSADTGQLTVRVLDDTTGRPIPARLRLQASDRSFPGDRLAASADRWPNIEAHGVFIAGEQAFTLPAGMTSVTAAHGLEYQAQARTIDIPAGKRATLEFRLKRVVNMKELGWVCGDLHIHMIHGENDRQTSYEDVALTCAASGLDFAAVGQEYVGAGTLDLAGYHEECRSVSTDEFQMFLGGERPKNILGHQVLLGCENPFLISEEPPYFKSSHAVHEQGGISVYVHPIRYFPGKQYGGQWLDFPGNNLARELIFDAYAGPAFDGLSVLSDEPAHRDAHGLWFNLLNRGFFVPAFADSDACFDRTVLGLKAPGLWNTYFYIGPGAPVSQAALCEAVRRGRTFATTGPLLQFQIDGQRSGDTFPLDGLERKVSIQAHYPQHAFSLQSTDARTNQPVGIAKIELLRNGVVVKQWEPNAAQVELEHSIRETQPCWYALRAYGSDQQWQVAVASPIYFARQPWPRKRQPREPIVRGRIYDFATGQERSGVVEIRRHDKLIQRLDANGEFTIRMPLDADITVSSKGSRPITKNLLMDYGPVHRYLWYLESQELGKPETFDRFEFLTREVNLEFPLGYRLPGCYIATDLDSAAPLEKVEILDGPDPVTGGAVAIVAILTDAEQIAPGDTMHVSVVLRDEGAADKCGPYVVEARAYDPSRPTGFGALKKCSSFETTWHDARDLGNGYKHFSGELRLPEWASPGPVNWLDISVRARQGNGDAAFVGLAVPLGTTKRALTLSSPWPTMPVSWPDRSYGIGPFKICNRLGRKGQPLSDYRKLHLALDVGSHKLDLLPARDGRGCPDAADAMYTEHYLDQILNDESKLVPLEN